MLKEALVFEALADTTRRRILMLLVSRAELCVCDIFSALELPQPKVSRHLGVLREAGLLAARKEGTWVYYQLHPQLPLWAMRILDSMRDGLREGPPYRSDADRMKGLGSSRCCG